MADDVFAPVTPGEMLREEFLEQYGLSQNRPAEIVNGRRRITADTALRLSLYFGNSPEFWLNLQTHYDLKMARQRSSADAAAHQGPPRGVSEAGSACRGDPAISGSGRESRPPGRLRSGR